MDLLSSGITVKREDDRIFPDAPPGFSAADSIRATIKREVNDDGESAVDDVDHLTLRERMRMLIAGGPSDSSSGCESRGRVPTCGVDAAVTEEACPSKVATRGSLPAVVDRAYIPSKSGVCSVANGASKNDPSYQRMGPRRVRAFEPSEAEHSSSYSSSSQSPMEEKTQGASTSATAPVRSKKTTVPGHGASSSTNDSPMVEQAGVHEHGTKSKASSTSRRGRGPTRGLVLEQLTCEGRVAVEFPQDCLRPVGDNARLFTSEVGVLCRSLIPATTPRWTDVTDDVRQLIHQRLQDKFVLDLNVSYVSHAVNDMIRERFKEYRGELHQRYKRCRTHDEAVLSAPPHVTIDDWRILCERFSSEAFQKRSRINSTNREKLQVNHVAGSKSFVRYLYDMRDSVTGYEPGPVDLYKGTHCRQATGSWVHPRANEHWAVMDTIRSQPTPDGSQRSEPEILSEVLGTRSGYVRGLGHGAKLMASTRAGSRRSVACESALRRADIVERGSAATGRRR